MSLIIPRRQLINWRKVGSTMITVIAVLGYILAIAIYIWWQWYTGGPS